MDKVRSRDLWNIYISTFVRFIANKLGRLLALGKIFSTQTLKLSPTSCFINDVGNDHKGLPLSYHCKSICWKFLPYYLKSTLLPSGNSIRRSFFVVSLSSGYWNLFVYLLFLLFYFLIISYCKVASTSHLCNYFFSIELEENAHKNPSLDISEHCTKFSVATVVRLTDRWSIFNKNKAESFD